MFDEKKKLFLFFLFERFIFGFRIEVFGFKIDFIVGFGFGIDVLLLVVNFRLVFCLFNYCIFDLIMIGLL